MSDAIRDRVVALIAEHAGTTADQVELDTSFEELGVDSLEGLTIMSELEDEFDVSLPSEEVLAMTKVSEAVESFQKHLALKSGHNGTSAGGA